jgi:hypothetical protein
MSFQIRRGQNPIPMCLPRSPASASDSVDAERGNSKIIPRSMSPLRGRDNPSLSDLTVGVGPTRAARATAKTRFKHPNLGRKSLQQPPHFSCHPVSSIYAATAADARCLPRNFPGRRRATLLLGPGPSSGPRALGFGFRAALSLLLPLPPASGHCSESRTLTSMVSFAGGHAVIPGAFLPAVQLPLFRI